MTHAMSPSHVASAAYATTWAIEKHSEYCVVPPRFMFVYLPVFVMAVHFLRELLEF